MGPAGWNPPATLPILLTMSTRIRVFAALFALLALGLSLAGPVWASECASEQEAHPAASAGSPHHGAAEAAASMREAVAGHAEHPGHPASCPSAAASGCVVLALPAHTVEIHPLSAFTAGEVTSASPLAGSLWVAPHFRPPLS
jgi:hypothetical protein